MPGRLPRISTEAALAAMRYSTSKQAQVDPDDGAWVVIRNVGLPPGYNYDRTDILVLLPPGYPLTPPDWFYMDQGLRRDDGQHPHIFDMFANHAPTLKGWAAGSLHIRSWRPTDDPLTGHSLLTVCQLIDDAFHRWLRE